MYHFVFKCTPPPLDKTFIRQCCNQRGSRGVQVRDTMGGSWDGAIRDHRPGAWVRPGPIRNGRYCYLPTRVVRVRTKSTLYTQRGIKWCGSSPRIDLILRLHCYSPPRLLERRYSLSDSADGRRHALQADFFVCVAWVSARGSRPAVGHRPSASSLPAPRTTGMAAGAIGSAGSAAGTIGANGGKAKGGAIGGIGKWGASGGTGAGSMPPPPPGPPLPPAA